MIKRLVLIILIALLVAGNVLLGVIYFLSRLELQDCQKIVKVQETNEKILAFANLFVNKVLMGEGSVDFENRFQLENAVRAIDDKQIFDEWQVFTASQGSWDTQQSAGRLLNLLFNKISK